MQSRCYHPIMRYQHVLIFTIVTSASMVAGFRSPALPLLKDRKLDIVQHFHQVLSHNRKIMQHRQWAATASGGNEPEVVVQIEDLSLSQIAELIEVSFIQACMQLAQGYVDVLKLFIVSVKSAYQRRTSCNSMKDIVQMVNTCPINTAGRPLELEEIQLRTTWIYAITLMLDYIEYNKVKSSIKRDDETNQRIDYESDDVAKTVETNYRPILSTIVDLQKNGTSLKTQEFMQQHRGLLPDIAFDDDVQLAIASQTVKVMYFTLTVLEEERLANDVDDMPDVARPQIPRGEGIN